MSSNHVKSPFPAYDPNQRYIDYLSERWADRNTGENGPIVVSTFAGTGGSSLGYQMAGFKELLAVEWDNHAVENFQNNFGHVDVYHGDIADLSVNEAKSRTGLAEGELDLFDGSPPCQGFSTAGVRDSNDERNQLFREYVRLLRGLRPKAFVMENVEGMVKGKMKAIFSKILRTLRECNYQVSARLLNAKHLNVPQNRPRMIFVGVRNDRSESPVHPTPIPPLINIRSALQDVYPKTYSNYQKGTWARKTWDVVTPGNNLSDYQVAHTQVGGGYGHSKPDPQSQIGTITKSPTFSKTAKMHWAEPRPYAIEEAQVLQSFPTEFDLLGSFEKQWKRIGNSVPPIMMAHIGQRFATISLRHPMAKISRILIYKRHRPMALNPTTTNNE